MPFHVPGMYYCIFRGVPVGRGIVRLGYDFSAFRMRQENRSRK